MRCRCNHAVSRCAECGGTLKTVRPPAPAKRLAGKSRKADRAERRERHRDQTAAIRYAAFVRADGRGELCGAAFVLGSEQLCHLNGGVGRRRQQQSVKTCLIEHPECHRSLDKSPLGWLQSVKEWAARHGYPVPERFRKLEAMAEAAHRAAKREGSHG